MKGRIIPVRQPFEAYADRMLPPAPGGSSAGVLVTFLGVTTLLIDDGKAAIMTDGFFTRPGLFKIVRSKVASDEELVRASLDRGGVSSLAAVIPLHSHYDHALDSPVVARMTGALLVGSESTANIGRGYGLADERIRVVDPPATLVFGSLRASFVASAHAPQSLYPGTIDAPLVPPARVSEYHEGTCYSLFVEHAGRTMLVHASAGFIAGALRGRKADVVYLGVGTLGKMDTQYREDYWREVVIATGARRVIVIHWDDFWRPLSEPLRPGPRLMDDFDATMQFLAEKSVASGVDVRIPTAWAASDPFAP